MDIRAHLERFDQLMLTQTRIMFAQFRIGTLSILWAKKSSVYIAIESVERDRDGVAEM